MEASALPVSDKPVTLAFKGGFSIGKPGQGGPSGLPKKPVPLTLAFSMDDGGEGDEDGAANETTTTEDPKGLSGRWETVARAGWLTDTGCCSCRC